MSDDPTVVAQPHPMPLVSAEMTLLVDAGSAWTKAALVARSRGRWRLAAQVAHRVTVRAGATTRVDIELQPGVAAEIAVELPPGRPAEGMARFEVLAPDNTIVHRGAIWLGDPARRAKLRLPIGEYRVAATWEDVSGSAALQIRAGTPAQVTIMLR